MNLTMVASNKYFWPIVLLPVLFLVAVIPLYARPYIIILLSSILMYVLLTLSWTIFSGSTGYISLATAAFFGVGIYTAALLCHVLPLPLVVLCGGLSSFLLAFLIGVITLRLRGVYFTIFTFGLVELIKQFLIWWEVNQIGSRGHQVLRVNSTTVFYILLVILVLLLITAFLLRRSRFGLALFSIRSSEDAAAHIGVNVTLLKVLVFALSAFFMGLTGAIMATRWGYIDPGIAFDPFYSFLPVLMAIFGGMGNLAGPVLGAVVFAYLQEVLITRFPYHYMLIFGVIMVVTIFYLPNGLIGLAQKLRRKRVGGQDAHIAN